VGCGGPFFVDHLWKKSLVVWFFLGLSCLSAKTEKINGTAQNPKIRSALTGHGVANRLTTEKSNL
jgi:hypothetical protein